MINKDFVKLEDELCSTWDFMNPHKMIPEDLCQKYFEALKKHSLDDVLNAIEDCVKDSGFFPKIKEIIDHLPVNTVYYGRKETRHEAFFRKHPEYIEQIDKFSLNVYYSPAKMIGGDYYDIVKLGPLKYGILLIDVSGHGVSASIIMSVVSFIFHLEISRISDTAMLMDKLSDRLYEKLQGEQFATGIFIIYDEKKNTFQYTNCGHSNILIYKKKDDKVDEIESTGGIPLGVRLNKPVKNLAKKGIALIVA